MTSVVIEVLPALVGQVGQIRRGTSYDVTVYNSVQLTSSVPSLSAYSTLFNSVALTTPAPTILTQEHPNLYEDVGVSSGVYIGVAPLRPVDTVATTSTIYSHTDIDLVAATTLSATATPTSTLRVLSIESLGTSSSLITGKDFSVTSGNTVATTSSTTLGMAATLVPATSSVAFTDALTKVFVPSPGYLASSSTYSSTITPLSQTGGNLTTTVDVQSTEYHVDPAREAWVLNTETTALSRYDSFGFNSMATLQGYTLAAGPAGLYLLGSPKDDGSFINASMETGFVDFKEPAHKRIDSVYVGHTTDGDTQLAVETYGPTPGTHTFKMEKRTASAPRATRAIIAKGLTSRYWRFKYGNIQGADFAVDRIDMNVMVTARRV